MRVFAQKRNVIDQSPANDQYERGESQCGWNSELPIHG
jgi:hypothetical protein